MHNPLPLLYDDTLSRGRLLHTTATPTIKREVRAPACNAPASRTVHIFWNTPVHVHTLLVSPSGRRTLHNKQAALTHNINTRCCGRYGTVSKDINTIARRQPCLPRLPTQMPSVCNPHCGGIGLHMHCAC